MGRGKKEFMGGEQTLYPEREQMTGSHSREDNHSSGAAYGCSLFPTSSTKDYESNIFV